MFNRAFIRSALILFFVAHGASVQAAGKGPNRASSDATSPGVQALVDLQTARALARYGESKKDSLALIVAARMTLELEKRAPHPKPAKAIALSVSAASPLEVESPALAWLARAKAIAPDRADLIALADDVGGDRMRGGGRGGPKMTRSEIKAGGTDQYTVRLEGGEPAAVVVGGDEGARLDLFVQDENGHQVCAATQADKAEEDKMCRFTPRWNGPFTVRIVNRGEKVGYIFLVQ